MVVANKSIMKNLEKDKMNKRQEFMGNCKEFRIETNRGYIRIIGNENKIRLNKNYGHLEIIGNETKLKICKNSGRVSYTGNNGRVSLGKDSPVTEVNYIGNNGILKLVGISEFRSSDKKFKATNMDNMENLLKPHSFIESENRNLEENLRTWKDVKVNDFNKKSEFQLNSSLSGENYQSAKSENKNNNNTKVTDNHVNKNNYFSGDENVRSKTVNFNNNLKKSLDSDEAAKKNSSDEKVDNNICIFINSSYDKTLNNGDNCDNNINVNSNISTENENSIIIKNSISLVNYNLLQSSISNSIQISCNSGNFLIRNCVQM